MANIQISDLKTITLKASELEQVVGGMGWKKPVLGKSLSLNYTSKKIKVTEIYQSFNNQNAQNSNLTVQGGGYLNVSTNSQGAANEILGLGLL